MHALQDIADGAVHLLDHDFGVGENVDRNRKSCVLTGRCPDGEIVLGRDGRPKGVICIVWSGE